MKTLRTPDERFANLDGYNFEPHYCEISDLDGGTLRVHYIDEGPRDADPVLLMHGEPSWCYLYRKMIPTMLAAGHRVIAPDLVGFGRSDKPTEQTDYSYAKHVAWMSELIFDKLQLRHITFFGQDWGGLVGLRLVTAEPERFDRVVAGNTGLPIGRKTDFSSNDAFIQWRNFSQTTPTFPVGTIVNGGCLKALSPAEIDAYDAPFPDETYKSGARIFPTFVPITIDDPSNRDNEIAWGVLRKFEKPFLCTFSDQDPVTAGGEKPFMREVPGAANQPHVTITDAGHFLQENKGQQLAQIIVEFIAKNPR